MLEEANGLILKERVRDTKLEEWAKSLFDESIIAALPLTNAKKKFNKLNFQQASEFYKNLHAQFVNLYSTILSGSI